MKSNRKKTVKSLNKGTGWKDVVFLFDSDYVMAVFFFLFSLFNENKY